MKKFLSTLFSKESDGRPCRLDPRLDPKLDFKLNFRSEKSGASELGGSSAMNHHSKM